MIRHTITYTLLCAVMAMIATACGRHGAGTDPAGGRQLTSEAGLLDIRDMGDCYLVTVKDPWDTTATLHSYQLIPRGSEVTPVADATPVAIPLRNSLVYSGVHAGAIDELGRTDAVKGVAEAQYFSVPAIKEGVAAGRITDVGSSMSPSMEQIIRLRPDAILTSPYKNAGYGALEQLSVPIIEMADYMESTPLGRAEWIKLIGLLYGEYDRADSIYNRVTADYNALKRSVADVAHKPKVITETLTSGVWMLPGGRSYKARMLCDAGADYPWSGNDSPGSMQLDFASVFDRAADADFWLTTTYGKTQTLAAMKAEYGPNSLFKAFSSGGVYNCDTSSKPLFDEFPFHPELLLAEYIRIFHPGLSPAAELRYFSQVE